MSLKRICFACLVILLVVSGSTSAVTLTTAKGNGADAGLENDGQSGNHGPTSLHGSDATLAIRRYDGTRQKMGIIRFDLTGIEGELTGATLTFNITSTANRARTWAIYGLVDETLDNWDEATICYDNAPGMQAAALAYFTIDATRLQRLGTMDVGAAAGVYTSVATSLDLSAFLSGDTNNLVTFYVIPDTTDSTATWYIASKEYETPGLAPMLTLPLASERLRTAVEPRPADGGQASRDVVLRWTPGDFAATHDVYLGTSREDVAAAGLADPRGTIFSLGQTAATYDPPGHLELGRTYYWRGMFAQYGLSEVRFYQVPAYARQPEPASGTTDVDPRAAVLSWWPGREAASHEVYLSTDAQAVADGTALVATTGSASYAPPALQLGQTYSWKVVEVNQVEVPSGWESDTWSFSTLSYFTVDDFEQYTEDYKNLACLYQTWIDGAGFTTPITVPGNGTGASVGHPTWDPASAHYNQTTVETGLTVPGSTQSMPLYYDNAVATRYSEAVRTFDSPRDWSGYGVSTLVLYFRGDVNNAPAPVYAKINGTKVLYNSGLPSTTSPLWKQWNIPLASLGVNLKSVTTLAIGVGDGAAAGTGMILIDDIVLYATAPQPVTPVDPGANGLFGLYAMEDNIQDGSGRGNHGAASGDPLYVQGLPGYGKALDFDGTDDYVTLPIGSLVSTLSSVTVAAWVNVPGAGGNWQRIFDFGSGTGAYMFLATRNASGLARCAIRSTTVAEQAVNGSLLTPGWHHLAVVIDSQSMTLRLYEDGMPAATGATTVLPKDMGVTTQNWLGRSQYTADPYFSGALDELRIYDRALSESEVRYLAGDR